MRTRTALVAAFAGGVVGTVLRWLVISGADAVGWSPFVALIAVNIAGSLLLGAFMAAHRVKSEPGSYVFTAVGVLGSFTTFSGFTVAAAEQATSGDVGVAFGFVTLSVGLGLAVVTLGRTLVRR